MSGWQPQGSSVGGAVIALTRSPGGWRDSRRSYSVMLDGHKVAKVRRGERLELPVSAGHHELYLKIDWCTSQTVELEAPPGAVIEMYCEPEPEGAFTERPDDPTWLDVRELAGDLTAGRKSYIRLVRC